MSDQGTNENQHGIVHTGTVWQFWCPGGHKKPMLHERRKAVVPVDVVNDLQRKADVLQRKVKSLSQYVKDAAGNESVLLPVATLTAISQRAEKAERELAVLKAKNVP